MEKIQRFSPLQHSAVAILAGRYPKVLVKCAVEVGQVAVSHTMGDPFDWSTRFRENSGYSIHAKIPNILAWCFAEDVPGQIRSAWPAESSTSQSFRLTTSSSTPS